MALPVDGQLVTTSVAAEFIAPRNEQPGPFGFFERGGVNIQDPSRGLNVCNWRFRIDPVVGEVYAGVPGVVTEVLIHTITPPPVHCSASFDTNMNVVLAWVDIAGDAYLRWFDPALAEHADISLPDQVRDLRCALDDVRDAQVVTGVTDTIVAYMREGALCYRQLRDRFAVEHELKDELDDYTLVQVGMSIKWRFQFQLVRRPPEVTS